MRQLTIVTTLIIAITIASCSRKKLVSGEGDNPSQLASQAPPPSDQLDKIQVNSDNPAIYMFYNGSDFESVSKIADVPESARGWVRIIPRMTATRKKTNMLYVADLRDVDDNGNYSYVAMTRKSFENAAQFRQDSGASEIGNNETVEAPPVILYATDWCGVCKKARHWLTKKNIEFVEKNIEKDRSAAVELQEKAKQQGISTNGVPVIDVGGTLMSGFDEGRITQLLASIK